VVEFFQIYKGKRKYKKGTKKREKSQAITFAENMVLYLKDPKNQKTLWSAKAFQKIVV
jgi:hypothetical protein